MYVTRLWQAAKFCEFDKTLDTRIMDHVLKSCYSTRFREKLLEQPELKLEKLLQLGVNHDAVKDQCRLVERREPKRTEQVEAIGFGKRNIKKNQEDSKDGKKCFKCAQAWPHSGECPAKSHTCSKCGKRGHFEVKTGLAFEDQFPRCLTVVGVE